jgi:RimJ/RimL family protein N-acetyltransferase
MVRPPELVYEIFAYTATEQGYASPGGVRLDTLTGMEYALITERLALCPVTPADHPALLAHWTLPDVRRFLFDGEALSAAEVSQTIEESVSDFAAGGYGIWLIREHRWADAAGPGAAGADGAGPDAADRELAGPELVGTVGLRPLADDGLEIFYSLAPGSWGRGYATEAARAVVGHALGTLGLAEVLAEVDEGNTASVGVVKRLGMVPFAVVPGELGPMTRYRTPPSTS